MNQQVKFFLLLQLNILTKVLPPFLLPSVSAPFTELPTAPNSAMLGQSIRRGSQPLWSVRATMRKVQGIIYHFQWKTSGGY